MYIGKSANFLAVQATYDVVYKLSDLVKRIVYRTAMSVTSLVAGSASIGNQAVILSIY